MNHTVSEPLAPFVPGRKEEILAALEKIDADTNKPRTVREIRLNKQATLAWLQAKDDEAVALRAELATL